MAILPVTKLVCNKSKLADFPLKKSSGLRFMPRRPELNISNCPVEKAGYTFFPQCGQTIQSSWMGFPHFLHGLTIAAGIVAGMVAGTSTGL
jgi:hypothetical protein